MLVVVATLTPYAPDLFADVSAGIVELAVTLAIGGVVLALARLWLFGR